jgi:hypothetical protein
MNFLNRMSAGWNISLFHYRNHGADYGRVLVGMQVPPSEMGDFEDFLAKLGYAHWNESNNPAYKLFLGASGIAAKGGLVRRDRIQIWRKKHFAHFSRAELSNHDHFKGGLRCP